MRIGRVAEQVGITVEAIRFYEKQGLIEAPGRNESGYREYPEDVVQHLFFMKRAKDLGFSLKEIKELMLLRYTPGTTCSEVKKQAERKIADIDRKMEDLQRMRKALVKLAASCPGQGPLSACPLVGAMGGGRYHE